MSTHKEDAKILLPMTKRGCLVASKYLKLHGLEDKMNRESSRDGYTIIALANKYIAKEVEKANEPTRRVS